MLLTGKVKESVTRIDADQRHTYDAVVLDAPPTGRITKFLDATREVANLTKFGPINRQSEGVIALLHGKQTAVHLVTLLEEMPVQETIDAAAELRDGRLPARRRHRQPGAPDADRRRRRSTRSCSTAGLRKVNLPAALSKGLAQEVASYADRLTIQAENAAHLDELDLPRIELPDLNPPVDRGELNELAAKFLQS